MDTKVLIFVLVVLVLIAAALFALWCTFGGHHETSGGCDMDGGADGERAAVIYGALSVDKNGNGVASGYGRIEKKEFNDLSLNGQFTLEDVKVKKTLSLNGNHKCFKVTANNVEVSGGAMLVESDVKKLVVHNEKVAGQKPNILLLSTKCEKIELDDKNAKEADFVIQREKGERPPGPAPGKPKGKPKPKKAE